MLLLLLLYTTAEISRYVNASVAYRMQHATRHKYATLSHQYFPSNSSVSLTSLPSNTLQANKQIYVFRAHSWLAIGLPRKVALDYFVQTKPNFNTQQSVCLYVCAYICVWCSGAQRDYLCFSDFHSKSAINVFVE